jgi:hypothetical protein
VLTFGDKDLFIESRQIMNQMGEIYRYLYQNYADDLEIEVMDPRNSISFFVTLLREKRIRRGSWRSFIKTAVYGLSKQSIIINGQLFSKGTLPSIEEIEKKINHLKQGDETA